MVKPNTMDDWITSLMDLVFAKIPDHHLLPKFRADVEKSITAKLQEVDRAARESQLNSIYSRCSDYLKSGHEWNEALAMAVKDHSPNEASLKGGDV